ncbi:MAG: hypothetical protein WC030_02535 [Candidatus Paceibacterota bacterium]
MLLALAAGALAYFFYWPSGSSAAAQTVTLAPVHKVGVWDNWNVAPFALTQEEACERAAAAISGFDMPAPVKAHFKAAIGTNCKGGTIAWLTPGTVLEEMWSTDHIVRKQKVGELPVLQSPDGREYRKGAVAQTARALEWSYSYGGKTYLVDLPSVCFNWSWRFGATCVTPRPVAKPAPKPVPQQEVCRELVFNANPSGKVWWSIGGNTLFPPSVCNAQRQGDGPWRAWYGECHECEGALWYVRRILGNTAEIFQKYLYPVKEVRQTIRFSRAVEDSVVTVCLENAEGVQTCGYYVTPSHWEGGRTRVEIQNSSWIREGNCPD